MEVIEGVPDTLIQVRGLRSSLPLGIRCKLENRRSEVPRGVSGFGVTPRSVKTIEKGLT